jgi:hypothetical protein
MRISFSVRAKSFRLFGNHIGKMREVYRSRDSRTMLVGHGLCDAGLRDVRSVAIHCRAGIGRSSVIAACTLICSRIEAEQALALISASQGVVVPDTDAQRDWALAFGKAQNS